MKDKINNNILLIIKFICVIYLYSMIINKFNEDDDIFNTISMEDIEESDIKNMIYSSNNLTNEEKDYLYNEALFNDILPYINDNNKLKKDYYQKFSQLDIIGFDSNNDDIYGYYNPQNNNIIYVSNYNENKLNNQVNGTFYKDTIAHEFIHLCQNNYLKYNFISEACAEIMSNEYFDESVVNTYFDEVIIVKKLMEIIGPSPIFKYVITGDFSDIDNILNKNLTKEEYEKLLTLLQLDMNNYEFSKEKKEKLEDLISKLYYNIYHDGIKNDKIINLIDKNTYDNNIKLVRYYFNNEKIKYNSYYYDFEYPTMIKLSLKQAYDNHLLSFKLNNKYITYKDYLYNDNKEDIEIIYSYGKVINNNLILFEYKKEIPCIYDKHDVIKLTLKK